MDPPDIGKKKKKRRTTVSTKGPNFILMISSWLTCVNLANQGNGYLSGGNEYVFTSVIRKKIGQKELRIL